MPIDYAIDMTPDAGLRHTAITSDDTTLMADKSLRHFPLCLVDREHEEFVILLRRGREPAHATWRCYATAAVIEATLPSLATATPSRVYLAFLRRTGFCRPPLMRLLADEYASHRRLKGILLFKSHTICNIGPHTSFHTSFTGLLHHSHFATPLLEDMTDDVVTIIVKLALRCLATQLSFDVSRHSHYYAITMNICCRRSFTPLLRCWITPLAAGYYADEAIDITH